MRKLIWEIIIIILIFVLILFISFGILYRPKKQQIYITPTLEDENPSCQRTQISCTTDKDCSKCIDNVEIKCIEVDRSISQNKQYSGQGKFCLPVKPKQTCNKKNGGIWTWTGWSGDDTMEWDCLCTFPSYAGGKNCDQINPNFCKGGNVSFDATTATKPPTFKDCTCPKNTHLLDTQPAGVPLCVPNGDFLCKDKKMCETMYSNSTFISP